MGLRSSVTPARSGCEPIVTAWRHRATVVEAAQYDGTAAVAGAIVRWLGPRSDYATDQALLVIIDEGTQDGVVRRPVHPGDWVVRDEFDRVYPVGGDVWPGLHEPAGDDHSAELALDAAQVAQLEVAARGSSDPARLREIAATLAASHQRLLSP